MAFRGTIEDYRRAGLQRLKDAKELTEYPTADPNRSDADRRHLRGAMYLAGYAAECLLKAYLVGMVAAETLSQAVALIDARRRAQGEPPVDNIRHSAAGHDIYYLLRLSRLLEENDFDGRLWSRVARWQSGWRYDTEMPRREVALAFVADVEAATSWLLSKS